VRIGVNYLGMVQKNHDAVSALVVAVLMANPDFPVSFKVGGKVNHEVVTVTAEHVQEALDALRDSYALTLSGTRPRVETALTPIVRNRLFVRRIPVLDDEGNQCLNPDGSKVWDMPSQPYAEVILRGVRERSSAVKDGTEVKREEKIRRNPISGIKEWLERNYCEKTHPSSFILDLVSPNFSHLALDGEVFTPSAVVALVG